jgi:hypothetical protein
MSAMNVGNGISMKNLWMFSVMYKKIKRKWIVMGIDGYVRSVYRKM